MPPDGGIGDISRKVTAQQTPSIKTCHSQTQPPLQMPKQIGTLQTGLKNIVYLILARLHFFVKKISPSSKKQSLSCPLDSPPMKKHPIFVQSTRIEFDPPIRPLCTRSMSVPIDPDICCVDFSCRIPRFVRRHKSHSVDIKRHHIPKLNLWHRRHLRTHIIIHVSISSSPPHRHIRVPPKQIRQRVHHSIPCVQHPPPVRTTLLQHRFKSVHCSVRVRHNCEVHYWNRSKFFSKIHAMRPEKKNKYARKIDAELDLHGMYRSEARAAVESFLALPHSRVRIITGKGSGAVRDEVRQLLLEKNIKFETAKITEGGSGAFIVCL